jgi:hypothetical protein
MRIVRITPGRSFTRSLWQEFLSLNLRTMFSTFGSGAIGNGTTAGRLRTTASVTGRVAGVEVTKASTDDLWNLSAQTATIAGPLAALPAPDETKCILGVYVANASTNFAAALAAQGTIYNGIPAGAALDGTAKNIALAPAAVNLIAG